MVVVVGTAILLSVVDGWRAGGRVLPVGSGGGGHDNDDDDDDSLGIGGHRKIGKSATWQILYIYS